MVVANNNYNRDPQEENRTKSIWREYFFTKLCNDAIFQLKFADAAAFTQEWGNKVIQTATYSSAIETIIIASADMLVIIRQIKFYLQR